jgi:hypothetical protein
MYGTLSNIAIAFIATALLVVMVDQMTRIIKEILPFPPKVESVITYIVLSTIASAVCWQGDFDLFRYLNFNWQYPEEGWILTGILIAGGSSLLVKQFKVVGLIPSIISGVQGMFGYGGGYNNIDQSETKPDITPAEIDQHD